MSNSKFGLPMTIQQPPPTCLKGPPKVPPAAPGLPTELEAAVTYKSDDRASDQLSFQAIVHLTQGNPTPPYRGSRTAADITATVSLLLFTEIKVWEADIVFLRNGSEFDRAIFNVRPYQDAEPFVLALATVFSHPDGATVTLKVMT